MELRTALFIVGMIVIVFIAFVSFHRSQQKPYKLPRHLHRHGRDGDEVDPLFEPRQGPIASRRADLLGQPLVAQSRRAGITCAPSNRTGDQGAG